MAEKAALQQVKSFLSDMKRLSEHLESAAAWTHSHSYDFMGEMDDRRLTEREWDFDQAMIHLEEAETLSLTWLGSFSLPVSDDKLRSEVVSHLGVVGEEYANRLSDDLQALGDACGDSAVRFACDLHAEIIERAYTTWINPYQFDYTPPSPDFVLYEGWREVKKQVRLLRRHTIQGAPIEELKSEAIALSRSSDELERAGKMFGYAWQVLSGALVPPLSEGAKGVVVPRKAIESPVIDFRTGRWFLDATNELLTVDTLRKAGDQGRIQREKQGKNWTYSVAQVKKRWPDYAKLIDAALLEEESAGRKRKLRDK